MESFCLIAPLKNPTASPNVLLPSIHGGGVCGRTQAVQLSPPPHYRRQPCFGDISFLLYFSNLRGSANLSPVQNSAVPALNPLCDLPICAVLNYLGLKKPYESELTPQPVLCSDRRANPPPALSEVVFHPGSRFASVPFGEVIYFFPSPSTPHLKLLQEGQQRRSIRPPLPFPLLLGWSDPVFRHLCRFFGLNWGLSSPVGSEPPSPSCAYQNSWR